MTALDPGGGWGGAYQPASALAAIARQHGLQSTSEKRDRKTTASGGTSDHWAGSKNAYAYDLGGSVKNMDRAAKAIAQRLGIPYKGGPLVATVNRDGLRYQILYRTNVGRQPLRPRPRRRPPRLNEGAGVPAPPLAVLTG